MKKLLAILFVLVVVNPVLSREPGVVRGSINVSFLWDTSSAVISPNETPETFAQISNNTQYKFYSHASPDETFFQTIVRKENNENIITFVAL